MSPRQLIKTCLFHARRARVRACAVPRGSAWLRARLHLPPNATLDPLRSASVAGVRVTLLDPAEMFHRPLPLLPADAGAGTFFSARTLEDNAPSYVVEFTEGAVWGFAGGAVFARDGRFVPALSRDAWGPDLHTIWTRVRLPRPRRLAGRTLCLVTPEAGDNYHHWLIDLLPRLGLVRRAGYQLSAFDHVIVHHRDRRYQRETLALLGLAPEKIIVADESLHVRADSLVVPSLKPHSQCLPPADLAFLRGAFLGHESPPPLRRRIFLSRRGAPFRRLRDEDELARLFARHGFEVMTPGDLSVTAQARRFAEAEWIAGTAGAGFANLVFASPGAQVIEFAPPQWLSVYHWMISARLGLRHTIVLGDGPVLSGQPEITARKCDVLLSPAKIAPILANSVPCAPATTALSLPS